MSETTLYAFRAKPYLTRIGAAAPPAGLPDLSRNKNNGTFNNAVSWQQITNAPIPGLWVNNFTAGLTDYITVGTSLKMSMGKGDQSAIFWFKMSEASFIAERDILTFGAGAGVESGFQIISITNTTTIRVYFNDISGGARLSQNMVVPNIYDSKYHLLAYVMVRASLATLYLDTVPSITGGLNIAARSGMNIFPRQQIGNPGSSMFGQIGGVRVPNYALTQGQINSIWESERRMYGR